MKQLFLHRPQVLLLSWIYDFPGKLGRDVEIGYRPVSFEETRVNILAVGKDTEELLAEIVGHQKAMKQGLPQ